MKPVLILQHLSADGPAYLLTWLRRHAMPHVVLNTQAGESFPDDMDSYAALAILGARRRVSAFHMVTLAFRITEPTDVALQHCLSQARLQFRHTECRLQPIDLHSSTSMSYIRHKSSQRLGLRLG